MELDLITEHMLLPGPATFRFYPGFGYFLVGPRREPAFL